jgi:hypothetical protein
MTVSYPYPQIIVYCGESREIARHFPVPGKDNVCLLIEGGSALIQFT